MGQHSLAHILKYEINAASHSAQVAGGQVLADHQRHLEHDGMVELAQVQTRQLLDLFQAVHQSVAMDKQLTGGFGNIQIVLEELIDGKERFLIQGINRILFDPKAGAVRN